MKSLLMMATVGLVWGCAVERQGTAKYSGGLAEADPIPWSVNFGKFYGGGVASTYPQALHDQVDFSGNPGKHRIGDPSTEVYLEFDLSGDAPRLNVKTDKSKKNCDQIPPEAFEFHEHKHRHVFEGDGGQNYMQGEWRAEWTNDKNQTFKIKLDNLGDGELKTSMEVHYKVRNKLTGKIVEVFDYIEASLNRDGTMVGIHDGISVSKTFDKNMFGSGDNCGGSPSGEATSRP